MKICARCRKQKTLDSFYIDKRYNTLRSWCKECHAVERGKWKLQNKEKLNGYVMKWREQNPQKCKLAQRASDQKRRKTIKGKLSHSISREIWASLRRGEKDGRHWETLVGYSFNDLKGHLEKQFSDGMTWANYGSAWHIDHIIPITAFNYEDVEHIDFMRCWSLKNLRPCFAKDNMAKAAKVKRPFQPSLAI